jgi:homoserine dehydrogenase
MKDVKIGLIGLGTVGVGVARLLIEKQALIAARLGMRLVLKQVADLDQETDRGISFPDGVFIQDAWQIVNDPDIDIVIETIGGDTIAKDIILAAIEQGKHVVTQRAMKSSVPRRQKASIWVTKPAWAAACRS